MRILVKISFALLLLCLTEKLIAQVNTTGCVAGGFGIDAGLYSGVLEFGSHSGSNALITDDWFQGVAGIGVGVIDQTATASINSLLLNQWNPTYEARMKTYLYAVENGKQWIDAVYARDNFGGTGGIDNTAYVIASKNGQDPAVWGTGSANVLGKNDIIDVGAFMRRDGINLATSNLWFYGLVARAEPGGQAYLDFEFYVEKMSLGSTGFNSGGPDMGHTAFRFAPNGQVTKLGDIIFNVQMINGGTTTVIELRAWVSRADYDRLKANPGQLPFRFGNLFDGAVTGAAYGYADILPLNSGALCGYVNLPGQNGIVPPWGHKGTKQNLMIPNFIDYSVTELGLNLSSYGIDYNYISGYDPCRFPYYTFIVKSRAAASFTAQLKDFGGPYTWGRLATSTAVGGMLSCTNPTTTVTAFPADDDLVYKWTTVDGRIVGSSEQRQITVDRPGTYTVQITLPDGCKTEPVDVAVAEDPNKPLFKSISAQSYIACKGNDGAINLTVTGGTAPYTYQWSNGSGYTATTQNISNLQPGTYNVTVTDAKGCTISTPATVLAGTPVTIEPGITPVTCTGLRDGAINLNVTGKAPFTYQWSNGNRTKDIRNIRAGSYSITITDADGCATVFSNIVVPEPALLSLSVIGEDDTNPIPGPTEANGSADLTVSGGTAPYTYLWSNGATTEDINLLSRGLYTVLVTDANNCTATISVNIFEPEICNDGIDNDGDLLTDCDDPDCQPPAPTGLNNPVICVGDTIVYTIDANAAYSEYLWTFPGNATVTSSAPYTNSVAVIWENTQTGKVCVRGKSFECISNPLCVTVSAKDAPLTPYSISKED
jgi:hypothetical protein